MVEQLCKSFPAPVAPPDPPEYELVPLAAGQPAALQTDRISVNFASYLIFEPHLLGSSQRNMLSKTSSNSLVNNSVIT